MVPYRRGSFVVLYFVMHFGGHGRALAYGSPTLLAIMEVASRVSQLSLVAAGRCLSCSSFHPRCLPYEGRLRITVG